MAPFRTIDTGLRDGRAHIAFDAALIDLHKAGQVPDTIRFLRFQPSALIGRHQAMSHEVKVEHCRAKGVGLVRRISGGGAIYLDEGQVGWEVVLSRRRLPMPSLGDYARAICEAVAHGLSQDFGIDARFRPRSDIEVEGRKLCGTGGFFDGDTLFYQGTVRIDVDPARMMACLNAPADKLQKCDLDKPEQRVTTLKALLGGTAPEVPTVHRAVMRGLSEKLGLELQPGAPSEAEEALAARIFTETIGTDEFVYKIDDPRASNVSEASLTVAGGTVSAYVQLEGAGAVRRVRDVLLTGDFFVTPPRMVLDLEAELRGVLVGEVGAAVDRYFAASRPDLLTIAPQDFRKVIEEAAVAASTT